MKHIKYTTERTNNEYKVTGIEWDCDGDSPKDHNLPTNAVVIAEAEDKVIDELSDKYGFCIFGVGSIEKL